MLSFILCVFYYFHKWQFRFLYQQKIKQINKMLKLHIFESQCSFSQARIGQFGNHNQNLFHYFLLSYSIKLRYIGSLSSEGSQFGQVKDGDSEDIILFCGMSSHKLKDSKMQTQYEVSVDLVWGCLNYRVVQRYLKKLRKAMK